MIHPLYSMAMLKPLVKKEYRLKHILSTNDVKDFTANTEAKRKEYPFNVPIFKTLIFIAADETECLMNNSYLNEIIFDHLEQYIKSFTMNKYCVILTKETRNGSLYKKIMMKVINYDIPIKFVSSQGFLKRSIIIQIYNVALPVSSMMCCNV